ncbi:Uncharacterised protein [Mycobacteroides abscessus subsp. abscessus]|nr:Uncharacterised protein [Mycobacteroides abscessus subsp. abscessus]
MPLAAPNRWKAVFMIADNSTPVFRNHLVCSRFEWARKNVIAAIRKFIDSETAARHDMPACRDSEMTGRVLYSLM